MQYLFFKPPLNATICIFILSWITHFLTHKCMNLNLNHYETLIINSIGLSLFLENFTFKFLKCYKKCTVLYFKFLWTDFMEWIKQLKCFSLSLCIQTSWGAVVLSQGIWGQSRWSQDGGLCPPPPQASEPTYSSPHPNDQNMCLPHKYNLLCNSPGHQYLFWLLFSKLLCFCINTNT